MSYDKSKWPLAALPVFFARLIAQYVHDVFVQLESTT